MFHWPFLQLFLIEFRIRNKHNELALDFVPLQDDKTRSLFRKANAQSYVGAGDIADGEYLLPSIISLC